MNADQTDAIEKLSRSAFLEDIRMIGASFFVSEEIIPSDTVPMHVDSGDRVRYAILDSEHINTIAELDVGVKVVPGDQKYSIRINASYMLQYKIEAAHAYDRETLEIFLGIQSVFNVWPFWREYVYSTTGRMGFNPLTLPLRLPGAGSKPAILVEAAMSTPQETSENE